ncbi:MAG: hypothetical protein J3K34DRAFT_96788 [Monoraphidium minutum]|nr:MAG: hypothetical protein J3K34DRAFT_96788 [Monoraphidium minutum]
MRERTPRAPLVLLYRHDALPQLRAVRRQQPPLSLRARARAGGGQGMMRRTDPCTMAAQITCSQRIQSTTAGNACTDFNATRRCTQARMQTTRSRAHAFTIHNAHAGSQRKGAAHHLDLPLRVADLAQHAPLAAVLPLLVRAQRRERGALLRVARARLGVGAPRGLVLLQPLAAQRAELAAPRGARAAVLQVCLGAQAAQRRLLRRLLGRGPWRLLLLALASRGVGAGRVAPPRCVRATRRCCRGAGARRGPRQARCGGWRSGARARRELAPGRRLLQPRAQQAW